MNRSVQHRLESPLLALTVFLIGQLFLPGRAWSIEHPPLVLTQARSEASPAAPIWDGFYLPPNTALDGSRIVLWTPGDGEQKIVNLTQDFAAACDPDISFDGERVLFSGKKDPEDPWDIWEMRRDGTGLRRLTEDFGDCREPVYTGILNTLNAPEWDQILFVSNVHGTLNEDGRSLSTALYTCKTDGTELRRITYNLSSDFGPFVLHDGRILYTSWQRVGNRFPPAGILPLMTVFSDGTDMMPFFGNHEPPILRHQARAGSDRWVYFIESDGTTPYGGGTLARLSLRRPLATRRR